MKSTEMVCYGKQFNSITYPELKHVASNTIYMSKPCGLLLLPLHESIKVHLTPRVASL